MDTPSLLIQERCFPQIPPLLTLFILKRAENTVSSQSALNQCEDSGWDISAESNKTGFLLFFMWETLFSITKGNTRDLFPLLKQRCPAPPETFLDILDIHRGCQIRQRRSCWKLPRCNILNGTRRLCLSCLIKPSMPVLNSHFQEMKRRILRRGEDLSHHIDSRELCSFFHLKKHN